VTDFATTFALQKMVPLVKRNRPVVDAGAPLSHQPFFVELLQFAAVGAIPLVIGVLPFVLEADADAIFAKAPQRFLQFVVELLGLLALQECSHFLAATNESVGCAISNPGYRQEKPARDRANSRHPLPFAPS
jgi:hypothetical protein